MRVQNALSPLLKTAKFALILWFAAVIVTSLAVFSGASMLLFRYLFLPKAVLNYNIDLVPRTVKQVSSINSTVVEQVALVDLKNINNIVHEDYEIQLLLDLPRNEGNRLAASFRVTGMLANRPWDAFQFERSNSEMLKNAAVYNKVDRMASIPYHSDLVETCRKLIVFPLLLIGFLEEKSTLEITLWNNAVTPLQDQNHLLVSIPQHIWVSAAQLRLTANLRGLRWLLQKYPLLTFLLGSSAIFMAQLTGTIVLLLWSYKVLVGKSSESAMPLAAWVDEAEAESSDTEETLIGDSEEKPFAKQVRKQKKKKSKRK